MVVVVQALKDTAGDLALVASAVPTVAEVMVEDRAPDMAEGRAPDTVALDLVMALVLVMRPSPCTNNPRLHLCMPSPRLCRCSSSNLTDEIGELPPWVLVVVFLVVCLLET